MLVLMVGGIVLSLDEKDNGTRQNDSPYDDTILNQVQISVFHLLFSDTSLSLPFLSPDLSFLVGKRVLGLGLCVSFEVRFVCDDIRRPRGGQ